MNSQSTPRGTQPRVPKPGGSGYGGSAKDQKQRHRGKRDAQKREEGTWEDWQGQLAKLLRRHNEGADSDAASLEGSGVLDILKQVLRCQAPNWWWKQPQRGMYSHALQVALHLTEHAPQSWGDAEDPESALAALEELAQTCKLLVSSSSSSQKQQQEQQQQEPAQTLDRIAHDLKQHASHKTSTHDRDLRLPGWVLAIHERAVAAAQSVLQIKECSALGADEHYRLKMRPLAFQMVDEAVSFEAPKHYYFPGGGHERRGVRAWNPMPKKIKSQKKLPRKPPPTGTGRSSSSSSAMALWKELSTYPTALPIEYGSSIFVRALESQLDKLRVLIIGPEDTPYANGCFVFDVTLGEDYPHKPPQVQFLTTSSFVPHLRRQPNPKKTTTTTAKTKTTTAKSYSSSNYHKYKKSYGTSPKVRFNPNLYDCGKVCLSLLGTWSGPSWTPNESTLLQVLVSLQSLVFCPHPYFNEPGYERTQGTASGNAQSKQYNTKIRQHTLRVAMLPFVHNQLLLLLRNKGREGGGTTTGKKRKRHQQAWFPEFQEVIAQHFSLKKQSIRKQLDVWVREDPTLGELYTEFWSSFQELQALQQSGKPRPNKPPKASFTTTKAAAAAAAAAACKTTNSGVILLDDGDETDEDTNRNLQQALANSLADVGGTVIDLLVEDDDSSDEEVVAMEARKPAAVVVCDEDEKGKGPETVGHGTPAASFAAVNKATSPDIVDLT